MPDFERFYIKIIGDSNLDKTVDKDTKKLGGFQSSLDKMFKKYKDSKITVDVEARGAAEAAGEIEAVHKAANSLDGDDVNIDVDVNTGGALAKLGALKAAAVGGDGLKEAFLTLGPVARSTFVLAIPAAIGVAVAALQPLMGGAAIGGSMVASVAAGFGLMALAGKEAFGKLQQVNGQFVAKTAQDANSSIGKMANYLNKVVANYKKAIQPASYAFAGFAADVLKVANKTLPAIGRVAEETVRAVHKSVNEVLVTASTGQQVAEYKRFLAGIPQITARLTHATGDFFLGIVNILSQATPYARDLAGWFKDIGRAFREWTQSAEGQKRLKEFFVSAENLLPKIVKGTWALVKGMFAVSRAVMDIFDLDQSKVNKSAHKSASGYVGEWQKTIRNVNPGKGEGSAGYELGYKMGKSIGGGLSKWADQGGLMGALKRGGGGGPVGFGRELGTGMRKGIASVFNGNKLNVMDLLFGKEGAKKLGGMWKKIVESAKQGKKDTANVFKDLGQNLVKIWKGIKGDAGTAWSNVADKIGSKSDDAKGRSGSRFRELQSNLGNIWKATWKAASKLWENISDKIGSKSDDAKSRSGERFRELWSNLKNIWTDTWKAAGNLWDNISNKITSKSDDAKQGSGNAFRDLFSNLKNIWSDTASAAKNAWESIARTVTKSAWDMYRAVKNAWTTLENFVKSVLSRFGIGSGGDSTSGPNGDTKHSAGNGGRGGAQGLAARGGVYRHVGDNGGIQWMARGGQPPVGGVATNGPRIVYGEAGPEAYVRLNKYTPESAEALKTANEEWSKRGWMEKVDKQNPSNHTPPGGSMSAVQRIKKGYDASGATSHNWVGWVADHAYEVQKKFAPNVSVNTYANHGTGNFWGEQHSVDHWGPGGRGAHIKSNVGDQVVDYVTGNWGDQIRYYIWKGMIHGWGTSKHYSDPSDQHFDHVHVTYDEAGSPGGLGGGVGGDTGPSPQELLFEKLWGATAKPALAKVASSLDGGFVLRQAAAGLSTQAGTSVHDSILQWIRDKFGGGSGGTGSMDDFKGSGMTLMRKSLEKYNLPSDWANSSDLWNIAKLESGTTPSDVHFEPNGPKYMAPWGIINPNRYGVSPGSPSFERFALGPRYVKDQYGTPQNAMDFHRQNGWYSRGGVVPGSTGKSTLIQAHGGERILPVEMVRSFDHLATTIKRWADNGRRIATGGNDHGPRGDVHDAVHKMRQEVVHELREQKARMLRAEDLIETALRAQDSPAGVKINERHVKRVIKRELARYGGD